MRKRTADVYLTIAVNLTMDVEEASELLDALAEYPEDHPTTPLYEQLEAALDRVPDIANGD